MVIDVGINYMVQTRLKTNSLYFEGKLTRFPALKVVQWNKLTLCIALHFFFQCNTNTDQHFNEIRQ